MLLYSRQLPRLSRIPNTPIELEKLLREIAASPAPSLKTLLTTGPDFEDLNLDRAQDLGRVSEW